MPTQNAYNNYIKRKTQTTQPINNFKEKVKNSLGGVATNNTYSTKNTNLTTPSISYSKPIGNNVNTNTKTNTSNVPTTPSTALKTQPTTPQITTPTQTTTQVTQPTTQPTNTSSGLMSLSDINNSYNTSNETVNAITTPISIEEVNDVANDPIVKQQAYSSGKTPQQLAKELLEEQKAVLQKDWETKQEAIKLQQQQAQNSYNQSVTDAENAYTESIDTINQDRYNKQQELNLSGTRRGIQYSPQQLGLETVANINTSKNITEAGKQRNELLNKLQIQLSELNAQILLSSQEANNSYNSSLSQLNADYMNKLMDWEYNEQQTEEERKWQEAQTKADREWQEKMDKADKDWQANQNALDRKQYGRSSGGSGTYSGYSSYSPSYSTSTYSSRSNIGGVGNDYLSDEIVQQTIDNDFKKLSTDAYNVNDFGYIDDLDERASIYDELTSPMYDEFYGVNDTVDERLDNTRETALKHLYNKSYARSTNGAYKIGNTVYKHNAPLRQDYIDKVKQNKHKTQADYYNKYSKDTFTKARANQNAKAESLHNKIMSSAKKTSTKKTTASKDISKKNTTSKKTTTSKKVSNSVKESVKKKQNNIKNTKEKNKNLKKQTVNKIKNAIKKIFKKK